MKTFAKYQETRQIAEFLINNQINVEKYCESIVKLAEQNSLNEENLSDQIGAKRDLQVTAHVMQSISNIDSYLKSLGYKSDLSKLTFGAVERAMAKWHQIHHKGQSPRDMIAKLQKNKVDDLINNPTKSQTIGGNYSADMVDTQNINSPKPNYTSNTIEKTPKGLRGRDNKFMSPKSLTHTFDTNSPQAKAVDYFNGPKKQKTLGI